MNNTDLIINQLRLCMEKGLIRRHFSNKEIQRLVKNSEAKPLTDEQIDYLGNNCEEYELFYCIIDPDKARRKYTGLFQ